MDGNDFFGETLSKFVQKLLYNKFVVIIGDSSEYYSVYCMHICICDIILFISWHFTIVLHVWRFHGCSHISTDRK